MTTQTLEAPGRAVPKGRGGGFLSVLRSEWTKLWSVRSTYWSLLITIVVVVGFAAIIAGSVAASWDQMSEADRRDFDPTGWSLGGLMFGQLAIATLGVLVISSEYSTGMIRTTFSAVPQRQRVLVSKAITFTVAALVVGVITSFGAFFVGQAFFATENVEASLGDPGVLRAVFGGGLYIAASGLFGLALGALLRHTAGAITAMAALLLVLPPMTNLLPGAWGDTVTKYFTSNAGGQITATREVSQDLLAPWAGFGVFCAWIGVILAMAAVLLHRRDA